MKKTKQFSAIVLHIVLVCFMALSIVFLVPACNKVPTENTGNTDNTNSHTEHTYVFSVIDNDTHKKTCSGCTEVDETEAHNYNGAKTCPDCEHVKTPSAVKVSASKTALTAGDEFTVTVEISADMPDYHWHSISLLFTALDSENNMDSSVTDYFEYVSRTVDTTYYRDSSSWNPPIGNGMLLSLSNKSTKSEQTLATEKITFEFTLKVKEDAPSVPSFNFGVAPIKAFFITYRNYGETTTTTVKHSANNVTSVNNQDVSDAGNCLTIPNIALSISAKAN